MKKIHLPTTEQLNRRVCLKVWSDAPADDFGVTQTFDAGRKLWARVEPIYGLAIKAGMNTGEVADASLLDTLHRDDAARGHHDRARRGMERAAVSVSRCDQCRGYAAFHANQRQGSGGYPVSDPIEARVGLAWPQDYRLRPPRDA